MLRVIGFLRCRDCISEAVDLKRGGVEDRIIRAVEDRAVRLIHVESTVHSTAEHQHRSAAWPTARTATQTSAETRTFARPDEDHVAAATAFALHALAHLLNTVFELVRIHAKVLRLSHGSRNGNRFGGGVGAGAVQRQPAGLPGGIGARYAAGVRFCD